MKLIPEAKQAWRLLSVQVAGALGALSLIQAQILPLLQPLVPDAWFPRITLVIAVLIVIARLWPQDLPESETRPPTSEDPQP